MLGLTAKELAVFRKLNTPTKIQDYLNRLPINFEKDGDTLYSPRKVLRERKAQCIEGALFAATALWVNGEEPLLLDLVTGRGDDGHVVALYKRNGYWGAISKTNHAVLRFRDPVYKTIRELTLSYYHEYFLNRNGKKTLRKYSNPFNLKKFGEGWVTAEENLLWMNTRLDRIKHFPLIPKKNLKLLRKADLVERKAGLIVEWKE
mgnify:CR=1 FL=1